MSLIDEFKSAVAIAQAMGNKELVDHLINVQNQVVKLSKENASLKSDLEACKAQLNLKETMVRKDDVYYRKMPNGTLEGKYCPRCYEVDKKLVHMLETKDDAPPEHQSIYCPKCNFSLPIF